MTRAHAPLTAPPPPAFVSAPLTPPSGAHAGTGIGNRKRIRRFFSLNRVSRSRKSTPNFPRTRYDHQLPTSGLSRVAAALVTLTRAPSSQQPSPHLRPGGCSGDGLPGKPPSSPGAAVREPAPRASSPPPCPRAPLQAAGLASWRRPGSGGEQAARLEGSRRRTARHSAPGAPGAGPRSPSPRSPVGPGACAQQRTDLSTPFVNCRPGAAGLGAEVT